MAVRRNSIPWSHEEVQTFLFLVGDDKIQRELEGATRNERIYQQLSEQLATHGYHRTFQQCREKLKKLKSDYRAAKSHHGQNGSNRRKLKWFDTLEAIYGNRPANNGREGCLVSGKGQQNSVMDDGGVSSSEEGTSDGAQSGPSVASTPIDEEAPLLAPPPTPPPTSIITPHRKRRRVQDTLTLSLKEMQAADVEQQELNRELTREQQELNRAQRQQELQMVLADAAQAREQEAALRREEMAAAAAFNQAFLSTLSQLVQVMSSRRDPCPPPLD